MIKAGYSPYWVFLFPVAIIVGMFVFVQTAFYTANIDVFALALAFDLLVALPIVYFLLIYRTSISKLSIVTVWALCLWVSQYILPVEELHWLGQLTQVLWLLLKLAVAYKLFVIINHFIANYKKLGYTLSGFDRIKATCLETFPKRFGEILSMEIAIIYFLFKRSKPTAYSDDEYAYLTDKGTVEMVAGFIFIILVETVVAHVLIQQWSPLLAVVSSYGSLYLIALFISILKSRSHFPIRIDLAQQQLLLQYGFINKTVVSIKDLNRVEQSSKSNIKDLMKLAAFKGIASHNLILYFDKPQQISKVFGVKQNYDKLAIFVDQPEKFIANLELHINKPLH